MEPVEPFHFCSFSYPDFRAEARLPLLSRLLIRDAQLRAGSFVRRCGAEVSAASSGLIETLSAWSRTNATLSEARGFPLALPAYREPEVDVVWAAAAAAMHLHAAGYEGEWSAMFTRPAQLRWGGLITPSLREVSVSATREETLLGLPGECSRRRSLTVRRSAPPVPAAGWSALRSAELGAGSGGLLIFDAGTRPVFNTENTFGYPPEPAADVVQTLERAGSLLEACAPAYLAWITDAMWGLIPIPRLGEKGNQSMSIHGLYGIPYISFPRETLDLADILVHESSHQYFHYVQTDTLLTNGQDNALYPSPYVGKDRSIDRILIAFHAFANVTLFHRACLAAGLREVGEQPEEAIALHLPILARFSEALSRSPGLTEAGYALFEPLRERLFG